MLTRGTQHLLRQKLLRVGRARPESFVLLDPPPYVEEEADAEVDSDDEEGSYVGGTVLDPTAGYYTDPVAVFDFASLYPSCMMELNLCPTALVSVADAAAAGTPIGPVPAVPWLDGEWVDAGGTVHSLVTLASGKAKVDGEVAGRVDDQGRLTLSALGAAVHDDDACVLRFAQGAVWRRTPASTPAFVAKERMVGLLPGMLADLKSERNACKARGKEATKAGRAAEAVYWDLQQGAVKVLMNACYGGLGARTGGVFVGGSSQKIAALVTRRGRGLIMLVSDTVEARVWLQPDKDAAGIDGLGDPPSGGFVRPKTVYGDTDSCFILLAGLSMAAAAALSDAISAYFSEVIPKPHVLEFEKILCPLLLLKKKQYAGMKYEGKYEAGSGSMLLRGIAAVRRDNCLFSKRAQMEVLTALLVAVSREEAVAAAVKWCRLVDRSVRHVYDAAPPEGVLPLREFFESGGLSKPLVGDGSYAPKDRVTPALAVARAALALNANEPIGMGTRITYVISAPTSLQKDGNVALRALDPDAAAAGRVPLDRSHYMGQLYSKLAQLLAPLYAAEEAAAARKATPWCGEVAVRDDKRKSDRDRTPGETSALRVLAAAGCMEVRGWGTYGSPKPPPLSSHKLHAHPLCVSHT